jgi:hypothetical protein
VQHGPLTLWRTGEFDHHETSVIMGKERPFDVGHGAIPHTNYRASTTRDFVRRVLHAVEDLEIVVVTGSIEQGRRRHECRLDGAMISRY